ncbi:hypothetical protein Bca52824_019697 [Brassica carinata]|uniref:Kinesin-like protein n=1 Tax=Brassica carinata TaxID=52824 RepID=A0A8X7VTJ4_BRACI|nr:hypothetical protein Bca52824_019697 [Brassica carinata]
MTVDSIQFSSSLAPLTLCEPRRVQIPRLRITLPHRLGTLYSLTYLQEPVNTRNQILYGVASPLAGVLSIQTDGSSHLYIWYVALRRYEAAAWLRETLGVSSGRDFPAEPSEEDFRVGLCSGIVLCNVLNKVNPGSVSKVVEAPDDVADGAALSAFQYFENIRNFLVAVEEMGLPSFEASDMEKGGKSIRIVNCILALKSYSEWKLKGGTGPFREILDPLPLVRSFISDKNSEDIPSVIESVLNKVMEEVQQRLSIHNEMMKSSSKPIPEDDSSCKTVVPSQQCDVRQHEEAEENRPSHVLEEKIQRKDSERNEEHEILLNQQKHIQELKQTLNTTKAGMQLVQKKYQEDFFHLGKQLNGLAHAATGYKRVLEENRKLYNLETYGVYCRVRPFLPGEPTALSTVEHIDEGTITIRVPSKYGKEGHKPYMFKVFGPSAAQEEVFSDMQPLIRSVLDGYNVCIFAYGQTGSGKTSTMTGPKELTEESLGVNYRALADLNNSQNGINVPEASLMPVSSTDDVIQLMDLGVSSTAMNDRSSRSHTMNDRSSRSHSCVTVHVQGSDLTSGTILHGSMHLSEVTGDRLKEAQHINKSLSALGDVISSLSQKTSHVPHRNSKLTQLLQDSLGKILKTLAFLGSAKTLMLVHISLEADTLEEAISTLKFAERVGSVELCAARVNKDNSEVKELKEQVLNYILILLHIVNHKMALARKGNGNDAQPTSLPHNPERISRRRSLEAPSVRHKLPSLGNLPSNLRSQIKDLSGPEAFRDTASSRRHTLDLHELMRRRQSLNANEEDREFKSGEWIDKHDENSQLLNGGNQDFEVHSITDNESDEGVTSDCSDSDLLWQLNVQVNVPTVANNKVQQTPKSRQGLPNSQKPEV